MKFFEGVNGDIIYIKDFDNAYSYKQAISVILFRFTNAEYFVVELK